MKQTSLSPETAKELLALCQTINDARWAKEDLPEDIDRALTGLEDYAMTLRWIIQSPEPEEG